jgi:hypothetical protein
MTRAAELPALALVDAPVPGEAGRSHIATPAIDGTGATVTYHKMWLGTTESNRFTRVLNRPCSTLAAGGLALPSAGTPASLNTPPTPQQGIDAYVAATLKSAEEAALQSSARPSLPTITCGSQ